MSASAAYSVGYSTGMVVGNVVTFGGILAMGVFQGRRLAKKRGDDGYVKWPIFASVGVALFFILGQCTQGMAR